MESLKYVCAFSGALKIPDAITCSKAILTTGNPHLFVKLVPVSSAHSTFLDNDWIRIPLDKNKIECKTGNFIYCNDTRKCVTHSFGTICHLHRFECITYLCIMKSYYSYIFFLKNITLRYM